MSALRLMSGVVVVMIAVVAMLAVSSGESPALPPPVTLRNPPGESERVSEEFVIEPSPVIERPTTTSAPVGGPSGTKPPSTAAESPETPDGSPDSPDDPEDTVATDTPAPTEGPTDREASAESVDSPDDPVESADSPDD